MKNTSKYESLYERLEKEHGLSYRTVFHADRADFNLPPELKPLTKGQQASFSQPVGGRPSKGATQPTPREEEQFKDENSQLALSASSTIQSAAYWPEKQYLVVSFKSGSSYSYTGVPVSVVDAWQDASSAGSFFYYNIRTSFPYQKM